MPKLMPENRLGLAAGCGALWPLAGDGTAEPTLMPENMPLLVAAGAAGSVPKLMPENSPPPGALTGAGAGSLPKLMPEKREPPAAGAAAGGVGVPRRDAKGSSRLSTGGSS